MTHFSFSRPFRTAAVRDGLLAAAVVLAVGSVPVQAAPRTAPPQKAAPANWLHVTVTRSDAHPGQRRGTLLLCDPPRGHAHAAEACAELAAAGGDIAGIPPKEVFCAMIYSPVTVHARGKWNGRPLKYTETFSNGCVMAARTGSVFALDR